MPDAPTPDVIAPRAALLSASDKAGLIPFARALAGRGVRLISTGGTAEALRGAGLAVTEVSEVTGMPEMMEGRVKTLHPAIHAGLLARRDRDAADLEAHGVGPIDLLAVTLYPFEAALARGAGTDELVETIDVGGPAMIRAAAKNHAWVAALTDPDDHEAVLADLDAHGGTTLATRRRLAARAYACTAAFDAAVAGWMAEALAPGEAPRHRALAGRLIAPLRYGENPHQGAAFYATGGARPGVASARRHGGADLSHNNIADADAALEAVAEIAGDRPACVIVKHANPCGAATGPTLAAAFEAALDADRESAFGGVVALSGEVDEAAARAVAGLFAEVLIAPAATEAALAVLAERPKLRVLTTGALPDPAAPGLTARAVAGGLLVQDRDAGRTGREDLRVVTARAPDEAETAALLFAWRVCKHVRSNAIVLATSTGEDAMTVGVGPGQTSRVGAVRIAVERAGARARGAVMASDAFFPFPDGVEVAAAAGVGAVIQPGGSVRDDAVIAAADEAGLAMVLTGRRHFRH